MYVSLSLSLSLSLFMDPAFFCRLAVHSGSSAENTKTHRKKHKKKEKK